MLSYERKGHLLYETQVDYVRDGTFKSGGRGLAANHVRGCAHGCTFPCYARIMSHMSYEQWIKPKLVLNAMELLEKDLNKYSPEEIAEVHLCFMTDPFMYRYPQVSIMTARIIQRLVQAGYHVRTLSKGVTAHGLLRDAVENRSKVTVGATIVSLDEEWRQMYEPHTARYKDRLFSLNICKKEGLRTWISMEPFPPPSLKANSDAVDVLYGILDQVEIDELVFGRWNYSGIREEEWYYEQGMALREHCNELGISCHIKPEVTEKRRK